MVGHKSDQKRADSSVRRRVLVVNVPDISPQYKIRYYFSCFENPNPGESFIIHNDHDPKPLYYQLSSEHGDVFTWELHYTGPEWYDIRVTLKDAPQQAQPEAVETVMAPASANGNEKVVDVPSLEPRLKHPTIFSTFDTLQTGESMIIPNDHDPKPVYYQLLSRERRCVYLGIPSTMTTVVGYPRNPKR